MTERERTRRATRTDVARLAGTSVAVVSYVVNGGPRPVAATTRARVLEAIDAVGYQPNTIARALASGVTSLYGLILPSISNPFFAALAHELEDAIAATGKILLLGDSSGSKEREAELVGVLARRRTDGVFFIGVDDSPDLDALAGTPTVLLDRYSPAKAGQYSVTIDNDEAAHAATRHLIEHGYTRLAIIAGPPDLAVSRARLDGWRRALHDAGITPDERWVVAAPFSAGGGFEAGRTLVTSGAPPRAVFASSEQQSLGLLAAAAEAGLRVPEDLAIMSFDGTEASEYAVPRISGIVQRLPDIAAAAVETLEALCARREPPARHVTTGYELRIRHSCGPHETPTHPDREAIPCRRR
ncbi:MAG TPA: LacI family DNA-binding transcriptional regulator [Microbacteriaceae bacterium]|nr:LacI family DNA-binding transcriptional regulator [Microbacteriaceae bacterium]